MNREPSTATASQRSAGHAHRHEQEHSGVYSSRWSASLASRGVTLAAAAFSLSLVYAASILLARGGHELNPLVAPVLLGGLAAVVASLALDRDIRAGSPFFLLPLVFLVLAISLTSTLRFPFPFGTDIGGEYLAGWVVWMDGHWSPDAGPQYAASLFVSVFPSMAAQVMGVDLLAVFQWVLPLTNVALALALVLIFSTFLPGRTSKTATLLFVGSLPFIHLVPQLARQSAAFVCLVLALYLLLRSNAQRNESLKLLSLALIFITAVATFHYTVSYFMLGMLALFFVVGHRHVLAWVNLEIQPRKRTVAGQTISARIVVLSVIAVLTWAFFFMTRLNDVHISYAVDITRRLLGEAPEGKAIYLAAPRTFFDKGLLPFLGNVTQGALIVGGFILLALRKKNAILSAWFVWGLAMLGYLGASIVLIPQLSRIIYPDRIFLMAYISFGIFAAVSIEWVWRRVPRSRSLLPALVGSLVVLNVMQLPAVVFTAEAAAGEATFVEKPVFFDEEHASILWLSNHLPRGALVVADVKGADILRPTPGLALVPKHDEKVPDGPYFLHAAYMEDAKAVLKTPAGQRAFGPIAPIVPWEPEAQVREKARVYSMGTYTLFVSAEPTASE